METLITITTEDKYNYRDIAKWGKFMAIVGFVLTGFMVLFGLFFGTFMSSMMEPFTQQPDMSFNPSSFGFIYILLSALYFLPSLFLLRYSTKIRKAITLDDQVNYSDAVKNLKNLFLFMGVLTAIMLVIYAFAILAIGVGGMIGGAMYNA